MPWLDRDLFNAAAVCTGGEVKAFVRKRFLPNYGVFDEFRYFAPGEGTILFEHGETMLGVTICEDMWQPGPPATDLSLAGAEVIVNISASPFHLMRDREREEMFRTRARDAAAFVEKIDSADLPAAAAGLRAVMNTLQAADVPATALQLKAIAAARTAASAAMAKWNALKTTGLAALNAKLTAAGGTPIVIK